MTKEGSFNIFEIKNNETTGYLTFLDKTTAVASANKASVVAAIKAGGKAPKLGKDMATLLGKVDGKQSAWMASIAPPAVKQALKDQPQTMDIADKINAFSGGV